MKLCLNCRSEFESTEWCCTVCRWMPAVADGFIAFSPELAENNDGLHAGAHEVLESLHENSFWFRKRNKIIQNMIGSYFSCAAKVLEIGCGGGYVLNGIRNILPTANLVATEIYTNGLEFAANKISQPVEFLQADARHLPFLNEFDLVGAFDVLEHIDEDQLVIENIKRSLKLGGGVILTVPQHPWLWSAADDMACHKRRYTRKQLSSMLRSNGFEILKDTSFMFFLLPLMLMQRLLEGRRKSYNPNAELSLPGAVDKLFSAILEIESSLIQRGVCFPVGGSRLVVARLVNK